MTASDVEVFSTEVIEGEIVDSLLGMAPADLLDRHGPELAPSTLEEARARAERIKAGLVLYVHTREAIAEAWARRDWKVLGYANWDLYLKGEFGDELRRLTGAERREAVAQYREAGMSTRAIASAVQAPKSTVADDVRQLPGSGQLPERVQGLDDKDRPAKREPKPAKPTVAPKPSTEDKPAPEKPESAEKPAAEKPTPAVDETERLARQRSEGVATALVSLWGQLGNDPIGWLNHTWRADAYRNRDLPKVRDVFTPTGLRNIARALEAMADHLDRNGETL